MFNLKHVGAQSTNVQSMTSENSSETVVDALFSQISLSSKSKIIKSEKMRAYKGQSENEHQRWFRDAKIKMMNASEYFVIDKVKILWCVQFLKDDSAIQWFIHTFDGETIAADQVIYLKFEQFLLDLVTDSINRQLIVYEKFDATHQKIDQKVSVFKIYLKEIKKELSSFDEYHKAMLFLVKLTSVLKNKLFIMRNVSNTRETILFKVIM